MSGVHRILVHEDYETVVTVNKHAGLFAGYYRAEYARFGHLMLDCLCVVGSLFFTNSHTRIFKYTKVPTFTYMAETLELDTFDISFSFRCPKCDYLNEEVLAKDLSSGNAECGMCETVFKVEGIDAVKITATLE